MVWPFSPVNYCRLVLPTLSLQPYPLIFFPHLHKVLKRSIVFEVFRSRVMPHRHWRRNSGGVWLVEVSQELRAALFFGLSMISTTRMCVALCCIYYICAYIYVSDGHAGVCVCVCECLRVYILLPCVWYRKKNSRANQQRPSDSERRK